MFNCGALEGHAFLRYKNEPVIVTILFIRNDTNALNNHVCQDSMISESVVPCQVPSTSFCSGYYM